MKVQGDFNSVNLSTGEKAREIVGDGERIQETVGAPRPEASTRLSSEMVIKADKRTGSSHMTDREGWGELMAEQLNAALAAQPEQEVMSEAGKPNAERPEGCICSEAYGVGSELCGMHGPSNVERLFTTEQVREAFVQTKAESLDFQDSYFYRKLTERLNAALQSVPSAVGQPSLEKLRERIESLGKELDKEAYADTYGYSKKVHNVRWKAFKYCAERVRAVLAAFEKEGK